MAEKDNSKYTHVTVSGVYQAEILNTGVTHRIYRYHVNIVNPGKDQPCTYDRDLHICEQNMATPGPATQTATEVQRQVGKIRPVDATIPDDTPPPPSVIETSTHVETANTPATDKTTHVETADTPATDKTTNTGTADTPTPAGINHRPPIFTFSSVKYALVYLTNGTVKAIHAIHRRFPYIQRRRLLPEWKIPATRQLFTDTTHHYLRRGALLTGGILLTVALLYFLPISTDTVTTNHPPPETTPPAKRNHRSDGYHAVIEKKPDGVVITIHGPEHKEVLTKLPPGYHPIVQGNKIVHIVTRGNTLWFIAKRYIKNPYRYPELARLNKIKNPDLIFPGDRVIIQYIRRPGP